MKIVMIDVDSTLYDADALFNKVAIDQGHDWYPKKSYEWFRAEHIGVSQEVMTNLFRKAHSREYVQTIKPYDGSVAVLEEFFEKNPKYTPWYVSSRHPQMKGPLFDWIVDHEFPLNDESHVIATMDKNSWLTESRPKIVIDDRVRTIIFSRFNIGAYVLSLIHNHNRNLTNEIDGVWMCQDWYEIGFKLNDEVLPALEQHGPKSDPNLKLVKRKDVKATA